MEDTNNITIKVKSKKKSEKTIRIVNGDCMTELLKTEDNSIDLVITDPPYFIDTLDNTLVDK